MMKVLFSIYFNFQIRESESGDPNEKIVNEDGFEFVHKKAENLAEKKHHVEVKEKLEVCTVALS